MSSYAIFSAQHLPYIGGIETFTDNLAKALALRGHSVTIVTNDTEGLSDRESLDEKITIVRLPCHPLLKGRLPLPKLLSRNRAKLIDSIVNQRFDGVLINTRLYPHSLLGMSIAEKQGLKPVVLDHGSAYLCFSNPIIDPLVKVYEDVITAWGKARHAADYYAISKQSAKWLEHFGIKAKGVISNSIDALAFRNMASSRNFREELGLEPSALLIAFIGRLIPEKGIHQMMEVAQHPTIIQKDVHFVIAGKGPLADRVKAAEGNLHYVGPITRQDASALLQQAYLHCLPSRSEGFASSLLEASACGCPSITTGVGGAAELIPSSEYGTIIKTQNAPDIVAAINTLANKPNLRDKQSEACKAIVEEKYSWDKTAQLVECALSQ
ncbi:glycosyltransferase family 4 protein [Enorma phocaeensis]|uniref:glycosyltransferase family 4 protein n=1 Tax=Enorma phocaeensis TaxID=1871019 RepID=UPI0023577CFD|nr:glycosyltransferase family 4 protein [Enorma phocaeensis]